MMHGQTKIKFKYLFLLVSYTITSECLGPQELFVYQTQNWPFLGKWAKYQNEVPYTSIGTCVYLRLQRAWMSVCSLISVIHWSNISILHPKIIKTIKIKMLLEINLQE